VLPAEVQLTGTVRSFDAAVQDTLEAALCQVAQGVAVSSSTQIDVQYVRYYPATVNSASEAEFALACARAAGLEADVAAAPAFTSEDFAFMLQQRPGAYLWLGQKRGAADAPLHHPHYDFNDAAMAYGVAWFCTVAQTALPVR